eukprot:3148324-Alexandrium_andersonii.AAC.1
MLGNWNWTVTSVPSRALWRTAPPTLRRRGSELRGPPEASVKTTPGVSFVSFHPAGAKASSKWEL